MSKKLLILFFSAVFLFSGSIPPASAGMNRYYDGLKKGWYWYEKKPEKEKKTEEKEEKKAKRKLPSLKDHTMEALWNMHPDDFQKLLGEFHKKAVMSPTEGNMYDYLVVHDIARRKALAVTNVQMAMMQKHPEFNVGSDYPIATPGRGAYTRETAKEVLNKIMSGRGDFGLVYFYSEDCGFCTEQDSIVKYFVDKYGWEVKKVEINANPRLASRFNVGRVPGMILAYRKSEDYFPVSTGVISLADMEERIYRGMRMLAGEISMEEYSIYDFQKGGTFDTKKNLTSPPVSPRP